jgi:hypothetical protein
VLRGFTLGGAVGTFIAYRRHQRDPELDPFPVITNDHWDYVDPTLEFCRRVYVSLIIARWYRACV